MTYASEVLADNPKVYLKLDETSGTTAADAAGTGTHPFTSHNATLGAVTVMLNGATSYGFDGTSTYLERAYDTAWDPYTTYQVECWFVPDRVTGVNVLFSHGGSNAGWQVEIRDGYLHYTYAGYTGLSNGAAVTVGTAYHFVFLSQYSGSGGSAQWHTYFYLNGVQTNAWDGSSYGTGNSNTGTTLLIGAGHNPSTGAPENFFKGRLDEFAYYVGSTPNAIPLSATRVKAHYDAGTAVPAGASGTLSGTLPQLTGSLAANSYLPPDMAGTLSASLPALTGTFAGYGHLTRWRDQVVKSGPVLWWDFEQDAAGGNYSGSAKPKDVTGNGLDGTLNIIGGSQVPALIPSDTDAKGLHLAPSGNWPEINTSDSRLVGASGSLAFTGRWSSTPGSNLFARGDGKLSLQTDSTNNTIKFVGGAQNRATDITYAQVFDGTPHLFVITWDGTDSRFYFDGVLKATGLGMAAATASVALSWFLGGQSDTRDVDDVVAWDKKLTASDVTDLYNAWDLQLDAVLPALTGSFAGKSIINATLDDGLPALTGSFAGTSAVPTDTVSLDATLPGLTGAFAGSSVDPGVVGATLDSTLPALAGSLAATVATVGTFADTLPALVGAFDGTSGAAPVAPSTTDTAAFENGRTRSGSARNLTVATPPAAPSGISPRPIRVRAISLPTPTLVNGRPQ